MRVNECYREGSSIPRPDLYDLGRFISMAIFFSARITVTGQENIPNEPTLFASTHRGFDDIPAIGLTMPAGRRARFLTSKGIADAPIVGGLFKKCGIIPIDRDSPTSASMHDAIDSLRVHGDDIVVFQEGKVKSGMSVEKGKPGVGIISFASQAPICPVGIVGPENHPKYFWPTDMHVHYGEPIYPPEIGIDIMGDEDFFGSTPNMKVGRVAIALRNQTTDSMQLALNIAHQEYAKHKSPNLCVMNLLGK